MSTSKNSMPSDLTSSLYGQVQRLKRPGAAGRAQYGTLGAAFAPGKSAELALFELCAAIEYPDVQGEAAVCMSARRVWHTQEGYGSLNLGRREELYFPAMRRDTNGAVAGIAPLAPGGRCHAWFNRQSGRWEAIAPPGSLCRFEMTASLSCGGAASATAFQYVADGTRIADDAPAETITVHDVGGRFSKMATTPGDAGAMGAAWFFADMQRWEILSMQTPGDFWGVLRGDLAFGTPSQTVEALEGGVLGGYSVFGSNHGREIAAWNPPGTEQSHWHAGAAGDRVLCRWDMCAAKYWILAIEPNSTDWQELDVVVRTSLVIDFNAQTFSHRDTTRRIKLPPWAEIGAEQ